MRKRLIILFFVIVTLASCNRVDESDDHLVYNNHLVIMHDILIDESNVLLGELVARKLGIQQQGGNINRIENYIDKTNKVKSYFYEAKMAVYKGFLLTLGISEEKIPEMLLHYSNYQGIDSLQIRGIEISEDFVQENKNTIINLSDIVYSFCGNDEIGPEGLINALRDSIIHVLSDEPFINNYIHPTTFGNLDENLMKSKHIEGIIEYVFNELYIPQASFKTDKEPKNAIFKWVKSANDLSIQEALLTLNHIILNFRYVENSIYREYNESFYGIQASPERWILKKKHSTEINEYELVYSFLSYGVDRVRYSFDSSLPIENWRLIEKEYEESIQLLNTIELDTFFTEPTIIYYQTYRGDSTNGYWWEVMSDTIGG